MSNLRVLRGRFISVFVLQIAAVAGFILLAGLALTACQAKSSPKLISNTENKKNLVSINSLLVAPVEFDSSVATNVPATLDVNAMLSEALAEELQLKVVHSVSPGEKSNGKRKLQSQYADDAKKMNLDGILITRLNGFNMREGSALGSAHPARVDLAMQILNSATNQIVWESTYHFKDQALSDNLFKIKDRIGQDKTKFRSAEDILSEGYRSALKDFSQKRLAGFIN